MILSKRFFINKTAFSYIFILNFSQLILSKQDTENQCSQVFKRFFDFWIVFGEVFASENGLQVLDTLLSVEESQPSCLFDAVSLA